MASTIRAVWRARRWRSGAGLLLLLGLLVCLTSCASNSGILGGGSWQASGLSQQTVQALAVDPGHLQHVYAGDTRAGVFTSTDAGAHWQASSKGLPTPLAVNALAFSTSGKKLYAATSAGLFVSEDAAASWKLVAGVPVDSYSALSFDVNTPQVIYAASSHSGVLMSRNDGVNWSNVSGDLPAGALVSVLYDSVEQTLWAASASAIYRSNNNGAHWQEMNTGLPASAGINVLAQGAVLSNGGDLIFAGTDHGFFRSSDGGQHWTQSQTSLADLKIRAILLDANQPTLVYISSGIGVLRSNDSGQNWNQVAAGLPGNQPFAALVQCDVNYTQLLVGAHGIYRYPGSGTVLDPSRFVPIVLIILFFGVLYYFFGLRRRRLTRRRLEPPGETSPEPNDGASSNGHHPSTGETPDTQEDARQEP